jgi:hypothetical protein
MSPFGRADSSDFKSVAGREVLCPTAWEIRAPIGPSNRKPIQLWRENRNDNSLVSVSWWDMVLADIGRLPAPRTECSYGAGSFSRSKQRRRRVTFFGSETPIGVQPDDLG